MKWISVFLWVLLAASVSAHAAVNTEVLDIAHRGYAAVNPESTLQAFQNAHQQGADGIEFDVRQTQDGVVVVTHDATVPTLSNQPVENILFADLYMATEIPSLEEVLVFAQDAGQTVWLEIKQSHRYPGVIDRVLALIAKYDLEDVTVIQSFNHNDLRVIKRKNPNVRLLALYIDSFSLNNLASYVDYIGLPIANNYLNAPLIQRVHAAGKQVVFWRRNDRSETKQVLQQFIDVGADGFMLDRPLKAIMQQD